MPWELMHPHTITVHFRWLRAQRTRGCLCAKLINTFLFLDPAASSGSVLRDNNFPNYFRAHVAMSIMVAWWFLKQYRLRAQWSHIFSSSFHPWPLRTKISPDSLNLFTILWTVDGERPKLFAILCWEALSLNWLNIEYLRNCWSLGIFMQNSL